MDVIDQPNDGGFSKVYAKRSQRYFLINVALFCGIALCSLYMTDEVIILTGVFVLAMVAYGIVGFAMAIKSFRRNEANVAARYIGLIGNGFIVLVFLGFVLMNVWNMLLLFG